MRMFFDPDSFERIHESISRSQRKCKLAVVDSFTLFMLLQLHAEGKRFAEHKITLELLRPTFSRAKDTQDRRKEKDIIYFLNILQDAGMITYELKKGKVFYKFVAYAPTKLSTLDEPRKRVLIKRCNRHIMEDYYSNAPFALHCLLRSLQRGEDGILYPVRISFIEMARRLDISLMTVDKSKRILEKDGYIFTVIGDLNQTPDGLRRDCNTYWIFNYDDQRKPQKNVIFQMRRQQWEAQKGKKKRAKRNEKSTEPARVFDVTIKIEQLVKSTQEVNALAEKETKKMEQTIINKEVTKTEQDLMSEIERVINNTKQTERYLFLGKSYDEAFDKVYEKICYTKVIDLNSVYDSDFDFNEFADFCTDGYYFFEGRVIVLRLKNRGRNYQTRLLVPLDRLNLPLLVFADNDDLIEPLVSRFTKVFKHPNENLKVTEFDPPNKILVKSYIDSPYACPSLIKMGDYNKLFPSEKKMDILISKLSGDGNVYSEVLSGLQPPIKVFSYDVKLEALSLLKKRLDSSGA